jgi:UDP-3-O-[3-hydroxymyristoyl] glucosamine N-acyltransferase
MAERRGFTLGEIAEALGGRVDGDASRVVSAVAPLDTAGPGDIAFVADGRYAAAARSSRAGALLVPEDLPSLSVPLVRCRALRPALARLVALLHPPATWSAGVAATAVIAPGARIDPTAAIGALAVVEAGAVVGAGARVYPLVYVGPGAEIGEGTVLHPHVVVGAAVSIGRRVVVHAGAVLGADGFGFAHDGTAYRKIPQVGRVVIEDDVEIGANATVDRAMLGETRIRRGAKIDNLVMVAHNVEIGEDTVIAAQAGIAGSSRIGARVLLGGQAGIADHVTIGDGARLGAQCGVASDVPPAAAMLGSYARPLTEFQRIWVAEGRLPELLRRVRALERRLDGLESPGRERAARSGDER